MIYKKASTIHGQFLDKKILKNGMKCVILNETTSVPSNFPHPKTGEPQNQDLAKLKIEGIEGEFNTALNKPTIEAMINAFGPDSINWQGNALIIEVEKTRVGGKAGVALYLIPEGYELKNDEQGFAKITKKSLEEQLKA